MPVGSAEFKKWVGVEDGIFILFAGWIIREVWDECVLSRLTKDNIEPVRDRAVRAVCYEVIARACARLAYHCLPEPIRLDINNEMGKNHAAQADNFIREKVAKIFSDKAEAYWIALDSEIIRKKAEIATENVSEESYRPRKISECDKFCFN